MIIPFSWAASSAFGDLTRDAQRFLDRYRASRCSIRERRTLDEFEDQGSNAIDFFEAVDRADVRMIQRREHARFALEAGEPFQVGCERRWQDLDRDVAPEPGVARAIDFAHATGADQCSMR